MGNKSHDLISQGKEVLFAYEEAIGYMFGDTVLDKDGISAAAIMAEYAGWLYSQGKTFQQQLEELYLRQVWRSVEPLYYEGLTSTNRQFTENFPMVLIL